MIAASPPATCLDRVGRRPDASTSTTPTCRCTAGVDRQAGHRGRRRSTSSAPNDRFRTEVVASSGVVDGEVRGDAYLVGGGDPLLSTGDYTDHFQDHPQVATSLEAFADKLVKAGLKQITGRLLGDESRYDQLRAVPVVAAALRARRTRAARSARLTVNDNFSSFPPTPGQGRAGRRDTGRRSAVVRGAGPRRPAAGARRARSRAATAPARRRRAPSASASSNRRRCADRQGALDRERQPDRRDADQGAGPVQGRRRHDGRRRAGRERTCSRRLGLPRAGTAVTDGSGLDDGDRVDVSLPDRRCSLEPAATRHSATPFRWPASTGTLANRFVASPAQGPPAGQDRHAERRSPRSPASSTPSRGRRSRSATSPSGRTVNASLAAAPGGPGRRARALPRRSVARPLGPRRS